MPDREQSQLEPGRTRGNPRGAEPAPSPQPGKLRLLFALAFAAVLAYRLADKILPPGFPPEVLYIIAVGAPLAAILLAWILHRGVFHALLYDRSENLRPPGEDERPRQDFRR